jgi:hypothetical protein
VDVVGFVLRGVGISSRKRMAGFAASSTAMETRFFCSKLMPPLSSLPIMVFSRGMSSSRCSTLVTQLARTSAGVSPGSLSAAENSTASLAVSCGERESNCST